MTFEDLFPFKEAPAAERYEHEVVRSSEVAPGAPPRTDAPGGFVGHRAVHRMAFRGMEVPGFPSELRIGATRVVQARGPIWTQVTSIRQEPGWRPVFHKSMRYVAVGEGENLTVCNRDVTVPEDLTQAMEVWRGSTLALMSFVVAVLDERIAQRLILEDLLIYDTRGTDVIGVADHLTRVRTFQAANRMLEQHRRALESLVRKVDPVAENPVVSAGRWYLRGAQLGPVADAVVFFWIALEALAKPQYGTNLTPEQRRLSDVNWIEQAVGEAGVDPQHVSPSIGRLAGLRAEVVHGGVEQPPLLSEGYYTLERLVRLLLRERLGVNPFGWPLAPDQSNLRTPARFLAAWLHERPTTEWE